MHNKHSILMAWGFASLLLLIVLGTLYTAQRVTQISTEFQQSISLRNTRAALGNKMREVARERLITLWKMSLAEDPFDREALYQGFFDLGSRFLGYRQALLDSDPDSTEKGFIERLAEAAADAAPVHREAAAQMLVNGHVITPRELLEISIPAQQGTLAILNELVAYESAQTDALLVSAAGEVRKTTLRMFYFLAVVLVLGGYLAVTELRRMRSMLAKLSDAGDELAEMNRRLERMVQERTRELRDTNEKLQRLASYDALTGLPNRLLLMEQLKVIMSRAQREAEQFALLFIDVDAFKQINDTFGHSAGDQVLVATARRIKEQVRACDLVARLAGDEFVVVLVDLRASADADKIAAAIMAATSKPVSICAGASEQVAVQVSIGVSIYPRDANKIDDLLHSADTRMYAEKRAKRVLKMPQVPADTPNND